MGFPHSISGKELACQCRSCKRPWLNPRVRKMPWRRTSQPIPVFCNIPWTEEPDRLQSWDDKVSGKTEMTQHLYTIRGCLDSSSKKRPVYCREAFGGIVKDSSFPGTNSRDRVVPKPSPCPLILPNLSSDPAAVLERRTWEHQALTGNTFSLQGSKPAFFFFNCNIRQNLFFFPCCQDFRLGLRCHHSNKHHIHCFG